MFIDIAKIKIKAGDGGNGCVAFHREKYIAAGGPDGGDGGRGGDILFVVDDNLSTLMDFRYKSKYQAQNGIDGTTNKCSGRNGQDVLIKVPRGTLIKDAKTQKIIKDMSGDESVVFARGGRGGWGNAKFATATRQAPRFAKNGFKGEEIEVMLELKLIADAGLLGFPNVGKSTLLSVVSKARPKIANYPFTTLIPNLGVVRVDEGQSFTLADIPGIIEGASGGSGLGHAFLRHIERCRLLVHLVDVSGSEGRSPASDFDIINEELEKFSPELSKRPQIVVANKVDIAQDRSLSDLLRERAQSAGYPFYEISAVTGQGVHELIYVIYERLKELPPVKIYESEDFAAEVPDDQAELFDIHIEDGVYHVEGDAIERLSGSINLSEYESRMYLDRSLRKMGVFDKLEEMGIHEGDTVSISGIEFDYVY